MGFKAFHSAAAILAGIKVAHMIRKNYSRLTVYLPSSNFQHWRHGHVRKAAIHRLRSPPVPGWRLNLNKNCLDDPPKRPPIR